jgi:hypothetical protein
LAKMRRKVVTIRTYENTDNFVNVAPWAATDFADCGEEGVLDQLCENASKILV